MLAPTLATLVAVGLPMFLPLTAFAAQPPRQPDAARLARAIDRLGAVGRVLFVAAHPDDENTRLLAWLANDRLVRAAYLSITRGDGGQNLLGPEQGVDLGIIRTQELLAARRIDGAEQRFTRARDFGFSKSPEEALRIWGKDDVLADVVWNIRVFQPDVIITRFPTSGMDTHGHHTASAILAAEAFKLAADPSYHPEQVARMGAWKARRLVLNKPLFNQKPGAKPAEDLSGFVAVDVGGYDPALGVSYGELAADSRSMHKSQGFGVARARGPELEYFQVLDGEPMKHSLFDGIDLTWARVPGGKALGALLERVRRSYDPAHPDKVLPSLAAAHAVLARLPRTAQAQAKLDELDEVMIACAGLHLDATAADPITTPGGVFSATIGAINRSPAAVQLSAVRLPNGTGVAIGQPLPNGKPFSMNYDIAVPGDAPISNPYWLDAPPSPGLFAVAEPALIGLPERPSPLVVGFELVIAGVYLIAHRTIYYQWVDPVAGERYRSVEITPAVTITPATTQLLFPDARAHALRVRLKSAIADAKGEVRLELPRGFSAEPAHQPFALAARGAEIELVFQVKPPAGATEGSLRAVVQLGDASLSRGLSRIEYPHIPIQTRFPETEVRLVRLDVAHTRTRIGYVAGAGDEVPAALRQVGYDVTMLSDAALRDEPLARFEAIVTGVRAFNTNARLPFLHDKLMEYVAAGGTLLVQYSTNNRLSKAPSEIGPYPFTITQDRVTDENAVVTMAPHAILQAPNRLGDADFAGWVQERGLYFGGAWDKRYETPLTMNDPGEKLQQGSLLVARVGKGAFVYTGLSFFRQLSAGVPGAFRLFANLIDYGR